MVHVPRWWQVTVDGPQAASTRAHCRPRAFQRKAAATGGAQQDAARVGPVVRNRNSAPEVHCTGFHGLVATAQLVGTEAAQAPAMCWLMTDRHST